MKKGVTCPLIGRTLGLCGGLRHMPAAKPLPLRFIELAVMFVHALLAYVPSTGMKNSVTELPFNRFLGIEPASDPTQLLKLPAGGQYLNHLGTVHASAQLALAEASSGEFLLRALGSVAGVVPVVRRLESKFRKPANGVVTSTVTTPPEALQQLQADLAAKGRAIISVAVELHDESGAHTLSATIEWFITRVSETA